MTETNRIEYKVQLTKDLDLEKEVVDGLVKEWVKELVKEFSDTLFKVLKNKNVLELVGGRRTGHWQIIEQA